MTPRNIAVAAGTLVLAGGSAAQALVQVVHTTRPDIALAVSPNDSVALARLAMLQLPKTQGGSLSAAKRTARASLNSQLLNPSALFVLGYGETEGTRKGQPPKPTLLVERLTRRSSPNQIWLVQLSLRRNDIRGLISHLDLLLRHGGEVGELVFPPLAQALADPQAAAALHEPLSRSAWAVPFLDYAAEYGEPRDVANILMAMDRRRVEELHASARGKVLGKLVSEGYLDGARALYATIPGRQDDARQFASKNVDEQLVPFTWQLFATDNVWASSAGPDGGLAIEVTSTIPVVAARRLTFLQSGVYRVSWAAEDPDGSAVIRPTINCFVRHGDKWSLNSAAISARELGEDAADLTIPPSCSVQYLNLNAAAKSESQSGLAVLTQLQISRR